MTSGRLGTISSSMKTLPRQNNNHNNNNDQRTAQKLHKRQRSRYKHAHIMQMWTQE